MRRAFSYIRFSDRRQMAGDSLRRQLKLTEAYCERKGLFLDESLNLRDLGVSGFHGKNVDTGALSLFLEAVKNKRVPSGSTLIVENLDRVSRHEIDEALPLFMGILKAGVNVVTVAPEREYTAETVRGNIAVIMEIVLAFVLANEESRKKSERVQQEWRERFTNLEKEKVTARAPAWLKLRDDRTAFELIPKAAATVRRMFQWAEDGYGISSITKRLNTDGTKPIGRLATWHRSYVRSILTSRSTIGEYQSYTGSGKQQKKFGEPIANYFPAVVTESQFYRVQKSFVDRKRKSGARGRYVTNLFTGLLREASGGGSLVIAGKTNGERHIVSSKALRGEKGSKYISFPYRPFEEAVLSLLSEVRAEELLPSSTADDTQTRIDHWSGRVCELDHKLAKTRDRINAEPEIDVYLDLLADLERQRRQAVGELDRAKQDSVANTAESLGELKSLVEILKEANEADREGLRSRLRAKIAHVVEEMNCHIMLLPGMPGSRGRPYCARVACVQAYFRGSPTRRRDYLIITNPRSLMWAARSFADLALPNQLDLRTNGHTARIEKLLKAVDLTALDISLTKRATAPSGKKGAKKK